MRKSEFVRLFILTALSVSALVAGTVSTTLWCATDGNVQQFAGSAGPNVCAGGGAVLPLQGQVRYGLYFDGSGPSYLAALEATAGVASVVPPLAEDRTGSILVTLDLSLSTPGPSRPGRLIAYWLTVSDDQGIFVPGGAPLPPSYVLVNGSRVPDSIPIDFPLGVPFTLQLAVGAKSGCAAPQGPCDTMDSRTTVQLRLFEVGSNTSLAIAEVPEPAGWALAGVGLMFLSCVLRLRRSPAR